MKTIYFFPLKNSKQQISRAMEQDQAQCGEGSTTALVDQKILQELRSSRKHFQGKAVKPAVAPSEEEDNDHFEVVPLGPTPLETNKTSCCLM